MFELDVQSGKPIYEKLMDKLKELMINEVLQEHNQLPSIRSIGSGIDHHSKYDPESVQAAFSLTVLYIHYQAKGISWHLLNP